MCTLTLRSASRFQTAKLELLFCNGTERPLTAKVASPLASEVRLTLALVQHAPKNRVGCRACSVLGRFSVAFSAPGVFRREQRTLVTCQWSPVAMVASVASLATASLPAPLKIANQNKDGAFSWGAPLCATENSPDILRRFLSLTKPISHICDSELSLSFPINPAGGIIKPAETFGA